MVALGVLGCLQPTDFSLPIMEPFGVTLIARYQLSRYFREKLGLGMVASCLRHGAVCEGVLWCLKDQGEPAEAHCDCRSHTYR